MAFINNAHKKGEDLHRAGNFAAAVDAFNAALETHPDHPDILSDRAVSYLMLEKYKLAIIDFDRAAAIEPNKSYRYSSRAFAKDKIGDLDGALADYEKAIELDPSDAIAHNNLGLLMENFGNRRGAKTMFELADKLNKDNPLPTQDNTTASEESKTQKTGETETEETPTQAQVVKSIFTKAGWKDFLSFVRNGFKLPKQ